MSRSEPYYNWGVQVYREFMMRVLKSLEPRYQETGLVIYKTIEEVEEMYFVMSGSINVGFEHDRFVKNVIRLRAGHVIGAYNCTMNKKTIFNYSVHKDLNSFIIRKSQWFDLMNDS